MDMTRNLYGENRGNSLTICQDSSRTANDEGSHDEAHQLDQNMNVWRSLLAAGILLFSHSGALAAKPPETVGENQDLRSYVVERVPGDMDAWHIPGAVVAVVQCGEVIVLEGFGWADVEKRVPVDPETTVFHVASLSKPLTATGLLQLAERDSIDIHKHIDDYFVQIRTGKPFGRAVTAAQLLTHTAGFDRQIIGRKTRSSEELSDWRDFLAAQMPPIVRPPGMVSVYSNYGYGLAGLLIEEVSGQPFERYMKENIFNPLGMSRSSFSLEPEIEASLATGYGWQGTMKPPVPHDYIRTVPASMLRTTAADMCRWMSAILEGGNWRDVKILRTDSAKSMLSRQFANHSMLPGRSFGLSEGGRLESTEFLHSGGATGFTAALVMHPELRLGIFVAFNSQAPPWDIVRGILDQVDSELERRQLPTHVQGGFDSEQFEGYYRNAEFPLMGLARIANLFGQEKISTLDSGQIRWRGKIYKPVDRLAYRAVNGDSVIAFAEAEDGGATTLFRHGGEYEKVQWYYVYPTQLALWSAVMLPQLAFVFWLAWLGLSCLLSRNKTDAAAVRRSVREVWILSSAVVLNLGYLVVLGVVLIRALDGSGQLEYGLPVWLKAVLIIPWITCGMGLLALKYAVGARKNRRVAIMHAPFLTIIVVAVIGFAGLTYVWNLVLMPGI